MVTFFKLWQVSIRWVLDKYVAIVVHTQIHANTWMFWFAIQFVLFSLSPLSVCFNLCHVYSQFFAQGLDNSWEIYLDALNKNISCICLYKNAGTLWILYWKGLNMTINFQNYLSSFIPELQLTIHSWNKRLPLLQISIFIFTDAIGSN